jgi:PLD-like domain
LADIGIYIMAGQSNMIVGSDASAVADCVEELMRQGFTAVQCSLLVEAILETKVRAPDPAVLFDLVLSGPEAGGMPTADTAATIQALIEEARAEVLVVSYVLHNTRPIFSGLAEKMQSNPALHARLCVNIPRTHQDTSLPSQIILRFAQVFWTQHWPWPKRPDVFYDPRGLASSHDDRASLHAKCVVVDRRAAIVTSANFTEAAQRKNVEVGVSIRYEPLARRVAWYFEALIESKRLLPLLV